MLCLAGIGLNSFIVFCNSWKNFSEFASGVFKNRPGNTNWVPYTYSAAEVAESSLGAVLSPNKTQGRWATHCGPANRARSASFSLLCSLSTIPLLCGWNAVVGECLMFSKAHNAAHKLDVNCVPRSEVMVVGTPNLAIHPWNKAAAQSVAEVAVIGMASGHRVDLSMTVKRCVKP